MDDAQKRLIRYLDDAWAVEKMLVSDLESMAKDVDDASVRSLFQEHRDVTFQQEEALEARIRALGEEPSKGKSLVNTVMGFVGNLMQQGGHDDSDKTVRYLMKAYGVENFEVAMYEALEAYASAIGDQETAALASRHRAQEQEAAGKVQPLLRSLSSRVLQTA